MISVFQQTTAIASAAGTRVRPVAARVISRASFVLEVARQGLPCKVRYPVAIRRFSRHYFPVATTPLLQDCNLHAVNYSGS